MWSQSSEGRSPGEIMLQVLGSHVENRGLHTSYREYGEHRVRSKQEADEVHCATRDCQELQLSWTCSRGTEAQMDSLLANKGPRLRDW